MKNCLLSLLVAGLCWMPTSHAANGIVIEAGRGDDSTDMGQLSLIRQWDNKWFTEGNWYVTGYWEASVGHWHSSDAGGKGIWDIGLAPVFRLQSTATSGIRPRLCENSAKIETNNKWLLKRAVFNSFELGDGQGTPGIKQIGVDDAFSHSLDPMRKAPSACISSTIPM